MRLRALWPLMAVMMVLSGPSMVWANSVETLPEGIFALGLKWGYKFADKRFADDFGTDTVSIVDDYNITITGADLDANMFTTDDKVGTLDVEYTNVGMEFSVTAAYGITDNLSIMIIIPIQYTKNEFTVRLSGSNMYLARNSKGEPSLIANEALAPGLGLTEPLNTQDLFDALSCDANTPLCQFRYKPIGDWDRWGLGEVITGLRYKFYDDKTWRMGITLFNKWPTGRHKNTDDLFDINYGDQQFDIGFWYGIDYVPIQQLVFNLSFGFTEQLPMVKEKRLWSRTFNELGQEQGTIPLTQYHQKEKVHIDYGGNWDVYMGFTYSPWHFLNFSNEYYWFWKYTDNYWMDHIPIDAGGNQWNPDFRAMEWGTQTSAIETTFAIGFSTIGWVQRGEFPVPLNFAFGYTRGIAGKHFDVTNSFWLSLDLIGSIYMFEGAVADESQEELDDFKLPARAENEDEADPDGALAGQPSERFRDQAKAASQYRHDFGTVRKLGW